MDNELEKQLGELYPTQQFDASKLVKLSNREHKLKRRRQSMAVGLIAGVFALGLSAGPLFLDNKPPTDVPMEQAKLMIQVLPTTGDIQFGEMFGEVLQPNKLGPLSSFNKPLSPTESSPLYLLLNLPGFDSCGWQYEMIDVSGGDFINRVFLETGSNLDGVDFSNRDLEPGKYEIRADCLTPASDALISLRLLFEMKVMDK
jgi:hypothetical protein